MASQRAPLLMASVARVTLNTTTNGQSCQNTFDYLMGTGATNPSVADLQDLGAAWCTTMLAALKAIFSPLTNLIGVTVQEMHYLTTPSQLVLFSGSPVAGTAGATNLDLQLQVTASRESGLKGKHGRGRVQLPAVPNTFVTPATDVNVINSTGISAYGPLLTLFNSGLAAGIYLWYPYLTQKYQAGDPAPVGSVNFGTAITSYILRLTIGTQRRRREGRGI